MSSSTNANPGEEAPAVTLGRSEPLPDLAVESLETPDDERVTNPRGMAPVGGGALSPETEVLVRRPASLAPPVDVEVSLGGPTTVSLPPASAGGMRIVRRRIKHIGNKETEAPSELAPPPTSPPTPIAGTSDLPPVPVSVEGVGSPRVPDDFKDFSEALASSPTPDPAAASEDLDGATTNVMPAVDESGPSLEVAGEVDLSSTEVSSKPPSMVPRATPSKPPPAPSLPASAADLDAILPVAPKPPSIPPPAASPSKPRVSAPPLPAATAPSVAAASNPSSTMFAVPAPTEKLAPKASAPPPPPVAAMTPAAPTNVLATEPSSILLTPEDGIEIAISDEPLSGDPSLAMLDMLADLPPTPGALVGGGDAIRSPSTPRGMSLPPPPPPEVVRPSKTAGPPTPPPSSLRATAVTTKARRRFWWEDLFNDDYFRTIEQLDAEQVRREADWIEHALGVEQNARVLDVGCGPGRQAIALAQRKYSVLGLDYSSAMLGRATEQSRELGLKVDFVQGDMAAMEFENEFDAAYCVGTSFGFFDDEKNLEVARRIHRALRPSGTFLLSVLNRDHAIQKQPAMSWFEGDGCLCMEESSFNYITSRLNVKRTMIFDDGRQRELEYGVRLYSLHELGQMLHQTGFRIVEVSGHQRTPGAFFGPSSRELIILAQRRSQEELPLAPDA